MPPSLRVTGFAATTGGPRDLYVDRRVPEVLEQLTTDRRQPRGELGGCGAPVLADSTVPCTELDPGDGLPRTEP